jgi:parvulin-like peptidyl-prolyl isomerase
MKRFVSLAFILFACSSPPSSEDPIARVNEMTISVRDYLNLYETLKPKDIHLSGLEKQRMRNLVLQTLVRRSVIVTNAQALGIKLTEKELVEAIDRIKSGYPDQIFQEMLLEGMIDENEWQEQVRQNLLMEKMFELRKPKLPAPSLEEALSHYEKNQHLFRIPEEVVALQIVTGDEGLAKEIRSEILKQNTISNFRALAKKHSLGPEAQADASIRIQKDTMPEEIDKILFGLEIGKISSVVPSPYGYHIFRILSRQPPVNLDFKQVRQQIFERLYDERKRAWLDNFEEELIRSAEIHYNRSLIQKL